MPNRNQRQRHAVIITIAPELLADLLQLPPGIKITGTAMNSLNKAISLRLDAPHFPAVPHGAHPIEARLTHNPKTKKSRITYDRP